MLPFIDKTMIAVNIVIMIIIIILGLGPLYLSSVFQDEIATEFVWLYFLLNITPDRSLLMITTVQ